jgi:uncharacterized protein
MTTTPSNGDPPAAALAQAIRSGDLATLRRMLDTQPGLAIARLGGEGGRTPLHVATDWPGYYPVGPAVVAMLIAAGADPNASTGTGPGAEIPLRWAASSDDVDVAVALIDGGADIEAPAGPSGRRWTTPSAMAAGTSRACSPRAAPGRQAVARRGAGHADAVGA